MPGPRRVHVVFKTHLDVGFTELAAEVVRRYREDYIPAALATARELRARGGDRLVWTTGSWLIDEALEHGDAPARKALEQGIAAGDLRWHALPFTTHTELLDPDLVRHGLSIAARLDRRFGVTTIAAKMTDVPGHTRGLVPLLAEAGVRFLHVGVNPASRAPQVPECFRWRVGEAEVVVAYDKGGYGGALQPAGCDAALVFAHAGDNQAPPDAEAVLAHFARIRSAHHGAEVLASTLDDFARELEPARAGLPEVTQEIGDTWIHGTGSDPYKTARLRALLRLRRVWLAHGLGRDDEPAFRRFSTGLLLVAEHTWGLDVKTHLQDFATWEREGLVLARRNLPAWRRMENSWAEQREFLDAAIAALPTELRREARAEARVVIPDPFENRGYRQIEPRQDLRFTRFILGLDPATGAIAKLRRFSDRRDWAGKNNPLALFRYQTFDVADYERFRDQYLVDFAQHRAWAEPDFLKPGLAAGRPVSALWLPRLESASWRADADADRLLLGLSLPDEARKRFGAPDRVELLVTAPRDDDRLELDLRWFKKPRCRMPEASWLGFSPMGVDDEGWTLDKLGVDCSPLDVVAGGNRRLHGVGLGARWRGGDASFALETLDAHLIAPGAPGLLDARDAQPRSRTGMHVNLHNNVWGTNFPQWYGEDARFRFTLRFG